MGRRWTRVAKYLKDRQGFVSKSWLYREIAAGRFPHKRIGGVIVIDEDEADEHLSRHGVSLEEAHNRLVKTGG